MDRILNQQREDRLRIQAENVRDREKAAAERQNQVSTLDQTIKDDQSVRSLESSSTSTAVDHDGTTGKTKGLMDRLRRTSGGSSKSSAGGEGVLSQLRGMGNGFGTGAGGGLGTGLKGGGGDGGKSTKRVCSNESSKSEV